MISGIEHSKLLQSIASKADHTPSKIALITTGGESVTYYKLCQRIVVAANFLTGKYLVKGDRIMLSAQKEEEFIYLYFGAHLCGIVNVVVDAKNNKDHLGYIASVTKPRLAFGMEIEGCECVQFSDLDFSAFTNQTAGPGNVENCTEEDAADIMFTSGTTGNPKGVVLSHRNICSSALNINGFIGNKSDDIELLGLPLCHSFGLGRLRCNMLTGATVVLHNGFANVKSVFSAIEKYGVTGFGMVPAVWAYIKRFSGNRISKYASQIRYLEIGSAAMAIEDKRLLCDLFPSTRICMHYGLTEASRSLFMEFHESRSDLSVAGKSVSPEVDVKIIREDGAEAQPGEDGEICVKGNMVMKSYYLTEDNEYAFLNGYFRTGDWGRKSESGSVYLVARKKELINVGGKKVSPIEIEDALEKIGVGESMCVAIADPDGILGEVPKAMLVKGTFTKNVNQIRTELGLLLEVYKMPREFVVVDSIPKTASGKKQRTI